MAVCAAVAGCGQSGSIGGFGASSQTSSGSAGSSAGSFGFGRNQAPTAPQQVVIDHGELVPVVNEVKVDRVQAGAIVRVKGQAARQGYYDVRLRAPTRLEPDENGVIVLELRAKQPTYWTRTSTDRSREVIAGRFISSQKLDAARRIQVVASQNQVTVSK